MSDDERLKRIATDVVRFEPTIEGAKTLAAAVLRLLAERDKLAAELRWIDDRLARRPALSGTRAERIEKAISVASTADRLAIELEQANNTAATACKRFAEVSAELADLRAAAADALKYAGFGEAYPFDRLPQLIRDQRTKCRNGDDRDYWRFVEEKFAALLAHTPEEGR